ncbi:MAG: rRNA pseudouridine synthase [Oscillospiraceae bacterium]|nr:rRNA pseudouridine synthase [Oscillospiraceae bacterium]
MPQARLQKILSEYGVASRRKAEELIEQGKVKVNGRPASLGDKADPHTDVITVAGKKLAARAEEPVYIMLNKPRGYVTTLSDELGRKCVAELVEAAGARIYPVERLDRDSEGLLLLTNDGEFANAVMHPAAQIPKYYRVTLRSPIKDEQLQAFREGMLIDGEKTAPAEIEMISAEPGRAVAQITLYEGRNRQIRRMCEALGLEVARLKRVAIGTVKLGMLPPGKWRHLEPKEVRGLVAATAVTKKVAAKYIKKTKAPASPADSPKYKRRSKTE